MQTTRAFFVVTVVVVLTGLVASCGSEDEHTHDTSEFTNKAACEAHYQEEGHSADEIAELCKDVAA